MVWAAAELPEPEGTVTWTWRPRRPADLTAMRRQLARAVRASAVPTTCDDEAVERLLLAFEELASNGVRHGGQPVEVRVVAGPDGWLIDVVDADLDAPPTPAIGRDPAKGGLGLHLIARLSAARGWCVRQNRKHVWACIRVAMA
jgi:anti-sigma regulatory factor (Ser/Thr protein kinase)